MDQLAATYPAHLRTLAARHDQALEMGGFDAVMIFAGAPHMKFLDDAPYPFKANPHFKAWVPVLDNPHCAIVYRPGEKPVLLYHQPRDYWHVPPANPSGYWVEHFDIRYLTDPAEARQHLPAPGSTAFLGEWEEDFADWGLANANPEAVLNYLHYHRACKTGYELHCMRQASAFAVRAHAAAEQAFLAGASEYEIHLEYCRACRHTEAELPYDNIIALNEHGAVLHYQQLERDTPSGVERHSLLIDAGAGFHGYAADVTRTYSYRSDEFQAFIDAVDSAQRAITSQVRPGVDNRDLHLQAHHDLSQVLVDHGFLNVDADTAVETAVSSTFFPHGLGHFIGLQVHDVGGFMRDVGGTELPRPQGHPFLRLTRTLEADQVLTIEPGIYFIDLLLEELRGGEHAAAVNWERVEAFRPFGGVRIEDDVRVTADGCENLTRDAFAAAGN